MKTNAKEFSNEDEIRLASFYIILSHKGLYEEELIELLATDLGLDHTSLYESKIKTFIDDTFDTTTQHDRRFIPSDQQSLKETTISEQQKKDTHKKMRNYYQRNFFLQGSFNESFKLRQSYLNLPYHLCQLGEDESLDFLTEGQDFLYALDHGEMKCVIEPYLKIQSNKKRLENTTIYRSYSTNTKVYSKDGDELARLLSLYKKRREGKMSTTETEHYGGYVHEIMSHQNIGTEDSI